MSSNRRSFLASLFAPLVARFYPKRKPEFESGVAIAHAYREGGHTFYVTNLPPLDSLRGRSLFDPDDATARLLAAHREYFDEQQRKIREQMITIVDPDGSCRDIKVNR